MPQAATMGDTVVASDIHIIMIPPRRAGADPAAPPVRRAHRGQLRLTVLIGGKPAATIGSTATNIPPHIPQGGPFQIPPTKNGGHHGPPDRAHQGETRPAPGIRP